VEPSELAAAVLAGWAVAWGLAALTVPELMAVIVGVIVFVTVKRQYHARWALPPDPPVAEPS
jgi:hypothetical protein